MPTANTPPAEQKQLTEAEVQSALKSAIFAGYDRVIANRLYAEWLEMRKAMEEAPHDWFNCAASGHMLPRGDCNCWKSKLTKERTNG